MRKASFWRTHYYWVVALFLYTSCSPHRDKVPEKGEPWINEALFFQDANLLSGQLSNGMRYFIQGNHSPKERAECYLIVRAGSVHEREEERGVAHLATCIQAATLRNLQRGEFIEYANANTSFDETTYQLQISLHQGNELSTLFSLIKLQIEKPLFTEKELERECKRKSEEKGPLREWIEELSAGTLYENRSPMVSEQYLEHIDQKILSSFYQKWYRPDRMALILVGDFDEKKVKESVEKILDFPFPPCQKELLKERQISPTATSPSPQFLIRTDKKYTGPLFILGKRERAKKWETRSDIRQHLIDTIIAELAERYFAEQIPEQELSLRSIVPTIYHFYDSYTFPSLIGRGRKGETERGLQALFSLIRQLQQCGFSQSDWQMLKQHWVHLFDSQEKKRQESIEWAEQYREYFLGRQILPLVKREIKEELLEEITIEEICERTSTLFDLREGKQVVVLLLLSPEERADAALRDEWSSLLERANVETFSLQKEERELFEPLLKEKLPGGKIIERREDEESGVITLFLSNQMQVYLKQTSCKEEEVLFSLFDQRGFSQLEKEQLPSGILAERLIDLSGVAGWKHSDVKNMLIHRSMGLSFSMDHYFRELIGWSSSRNLPHFLSFLHLKCTELNREPKTLRFLVENMREEIQSDSEEGGEILRSHLTQKNSGGHSHFKPIKERALKQLNTEEVFVLTEKFLTFQAPCFASFVGDFQEEDLLPLIESYLASLPLGHLEGKEPEEYPLSFPLASSSETLYGGRDWEMQSVLFFPVFYGQLSSSSSLREELFWLNFINSLLENRLLEVLASEGIDSDKLSVSHSPFPYFSCKEGRVHIFFTCQTERRTEIEEYIRQEIQEICLSGFSKREIENVRVVWQQHFESALESNSFWQDQIRAALLYKEGSFREITLRLGRFSSPLFEEELQKYLPLFFSEAKERMNALSLIPEETEL